MRRVASEASLGPTKTKRKIKAANWFGHFRGSGRTNYRMARSSRRPTITSSSRSPGTVGSSQDRCRRRRYDRAGRDRSRPLRMGLQAAPRADEATTTRTISSATKTSPSGTRWRSTTRTTAPPSRPLRRRQSRGRPRAWPSWTPLPHPQGAAEATRRSRRSVAAASGVDSGAVPRPRAASFASNSSDSATRQRSFLKMIDATEG